MRTTYKVFVALAALALPRGLACAAQSSSAPPPAVSVSEIDALVEDALRRAKAPGAAVTIVQGDKVILAKGYGVRSLATGKPMSSRTLWPIQSETKAFTALSAAILQDEKKLDLDAPISRYIPGFRMQSDVATLEVSMRDFLTHRSGLPSHRLLWISNESLGRPEAVRRIRALPLAGPIRTKWRYANLGYVAVAHAVERVAGTPWETFTTQRILGPLGMHRSTLSRQRAEADPDHIDGSMFRLGRVEVTPMQGTTPSTLSTGGIYSTAEDMANWMRVQLNEGRLGNRQVFSASTIAETHKAQTVTELPLPSPEFSSSAYGLGWFNHSYRGYQLVEHGGGHWGVQSSLGLVPDRRFGVSIFINQHGDLARALMWTIVDRVVGGPPNDWVGMAVEDMAAAQAENVKAHTSQIVRRAGEAPPYPLSGYAGRYEHPGFGVIGVQAVKGELVIRYDDDTSGLSHVGKNVFAPNATEFGNIWGMYDDTRVAFSGFLNGRVTELRTSQTGPDVIFRRID